MGKQFAIDIGSQSIGWAIIDTDGNYPVKAGVIILPSNTSSVSKKTVITNNIIYDFLCKFLKFFRIGRHGNKKIVLIILICIPAITLFVAVLNYTNWQFWLNISLTSLVSLCSIFYQYKK